MSEEKTSLGLTPSLTAALAYLLGFVSGIIVFVLERENRFVRFHSMQSILLSIVFFVLNVVVGFIPIVGPLLGIIVCLGGVLCWLIALVKAAQGYYYKLPIIGDYADKQI
ncbi:MAG: DUF4870 domain-containing protein [Thermincola sp.]|nr:DUF4870 domain-containing protein [Thermincola sp.]MDT3702561.1 DUF4870 domain-containing protein [Thermincola sp.]